MLALCVAATNACSVAARHDVRQRAAFLVGGVQHQTGKAGIACPLDEIEIDAAIGKQHADQQDAIEIEARKCAQIVGSAGAGR